MNHDTIADLVMEMIGHGMADDTDRTAEILTRIGNASTASEMYAVCCAIASTGTHALRRLYGVSAGASWALEENVPGVLTDDPPRAFGARFLVAYASGDRPTCAALYRAATLATDEEYIASVCALLAHVCGIARLAADELAAGRLPG
ncbi:hypothetical protein [Streptomyces sp. CB03911]|uniref:hypothetical protein n=1 Tax=Streptomyces sp. CB03911 TaxID=1804758 RepID=UPI00093FC361|nr:hypothetical protein [Streptomyces sp. CB03911]OKI22229.1 hypothetical protein A6A07_34715 [Streptomyces sp. CB03911]